jgi:hypothetical protein
MFVCELLLSKRCRCGPLPGFAEIDSPSQHMLGESIRLIHHPPAVPPSQSPHREDVGPSLPNDCHLAVLGKAVRSEIEPEHSKGPSTLAA